MKNLYGDDESEGTLENEKPQIIAESNPARAGRSDFADDVNMVDYVDQVRPFQPEVIQM